MGGPADQGACGSAADPALTRYRSSPERLPPNRLVRLRPMSAETRATPRAATMTWTRSSSQSMPFVTDRDAHGAGKRRADERRDDADQDRQEHPDRLPTGTKSRPITPTTMPIRIALRMPVIVIVPPTETGLQPEYPECAGENDPQARERGHRGTRRRHRPAPHRRSHRRRALILRRPPGRPVQRRAARHRRGRDHRDGAGSDEDLVDTLERLLPRDDRYRHAHGSPATARTTSCRRWWHRR